MSFEFWALSFCIIFQPYHISTHNPPPITHNPRPQPITHNSFHKKLPHSNPRPFSDLGSSRENKRKKRIEKACVSKKRMYFCTRFQKQNVLWVRRKPWLSRVAEKKYLKKILNKCCGKEKRLYVCRPVRQRLNRVKWKNEVLWNNAAINFR